MTTRELALKGQATKKHSWEPKARSVSVCRHCGIKRTYWADHGQRWTAWESAGGLFLGNSWEIKTPPCEPAVPREVPKGVAEGSQA